MSREPGKEERDTRETGEDAFDKCFANLLAEAENKEPAQAPLDILEQDIYDLNPGLLDILLRDHTTGGYILWACNEYASYGEAYAADREMTPDLIIGKHTTLIQPRVAKSREDQRKRTRKSAEVFTPAWLCEEMINICDEEWFGMNEGFDTPPDNHKYQPTSSHFAFAFGKSWQEYVARPCLEVACGEAPYLVSRYDATSGEFLPVEKRVGVLDRKLRLVNELTRNESGWFHHARKAFTSTYGYEFQGDNLLLARENLLWTFVDYYRARWRHAPAMEQLLKIARIISCNIWQMDGLTDSIPFSKPDDGQPDLFLFANRGSSRPSPSLCKIHIWRRNKDFYFKHLKENPSMKFDVVIGNPPYQQEVGKLSATNGQQASKSIFHHFQMAADSILKGVSVMIYPGGRWIQRSGKGMAQFGRQQINDIKLKILYFYPRSEELFQGIEIADGVSIVVKDARKTKEGFDYVYSVNGEQFMLKMKAPGDEVFPLHPHDVNLTKKIERFVNRYRLSYLDDAILPRNLFGIESDFVENNPSLVRLLAEVENIEWGKEIKLFTNNRAGKAGRATWYVADRDVIQRGQEYIDQWQVVVSSANAGGQKRDWQLEIIDNHSAFGRSRVALRSFSTKKAAENFYKYVSSTVIRFAFLLTDEALTTLAQKVPDILDYTDRNDFIDFSEDVDLQLKHLMGLTDAELAYMREKLENIRKK